MLALVLSRSEEKGESYRINRTAFLPLLFVSGRAACANEKLSKITNYNLTSALMLTACFCRMHFTD
jgi:hypothetical protein